MKFLNKVISLALCGFSIACNPVPTNSGSGIIFSNVKEPVAFSNGVSSLKTGQSCQGSFLGLFAFGDASIEKAKQDGGITKIATINLEKKGVLVYGKS